MENTPKSSSGGSMRGKVSNYPHGPASLILKPMRDDVVDVMNSFRNLNVFLKTPDGRLLAGDIKMSEFGCIVVLDLKEAGAISSGGFINEYDENRPYNSGESFALKADRILNGNLIQAGRWVVPEAGTDGAGTWAGYLPANPTATTSFVDVSNPPTLGAAPNDKFYARLVSGICGGV